MVLLGDADLEELQESEKIIFNPSFVAVLEALLLDMYTVLRPRPSDYEHRRHLVQIFNVMANDIYGSRGGYPLVEAFGSFVMDTFTSSSDLDLSVNFTNDKTTVFPRDEKISALRKLARVLYGHQRRGHVFGVLPIMKARVPILKVVDRGTAVECDISIENKDGITRSLILRYVASIDERFQILSVLMKAWAKAHDINSSKDRTMSSLTIVSLVAFHLQTRDPPILPAFSALLKDGTDITSIQNAVHGFKHFGRRNEESIAELFVALIRKLASVETCWQQGLCASTYKGSWISKTWESGIGNLSVEDFLDRSQNFARSVGKEEVKKIFKCIERSFIQLSRFMEGRMEASKLKTNLFGPITLDMPNDQLIHNEGINLKRRAPLNDMTSKRARFEVAGELNHHSNEILTNTPLINPFIHLRPPFVSSQFGHEVHHLEPQFVPSQPGFGSQHHPQPPFIPSQLGYGSEHRALPSIPFHLGNGSQYHQYDPKPMLPLPWDDWHGHIQSGYQSQYLEHPQHPFAPF